MDYKIVIDAGHGGDDPGASGNGIVEKDYTLKISEYMYDRFKALGIPVSITRTEDVTLTPEERVEKIQDFYGKGNDVVVISNHINAGGGDGAEVIYALRNSDALAEEITEEIAKEGQNVRKFYQRRLPSDPAQDYYFIQRDTPNNETVIVEYGFLDTSADAIRIKENWKDYAEAVVRAVAENKNLKYVPISGDYYTVQKGDSLWSIAKKYGLTVNELKSLNNLTSNLLQIGDVLKVKEEISPDIPDTYVVKRGDTLYSIARDYNLTVDELKRLNNLTSNTLSIGQTLLLKSSAPSVIDTNTYIVKSGDTLYGIARDNGTTVSELKELNNLTSNNLSIGQVLKLPQAPGEYQVYTVVSGDNLYQIARRFNTTVTAIQNLNNLASSSLSIGQKLLIPN